MGEYKIRKDLPIPAGDKDRGLSATIRAMAYGDSLVIPAKQHLGVHACARSVGAKVKTKSNDDGTVTVWRVDSAAEPRPGAQASPRATASGTASVAAGDITAADACRTSEDPLWKSIMTPDGDFPTGHYVQETPYGPNIFYPDLDELGRPVNLARKKEQTVEDIFS